MRLHRFGENKPNGQSRPHGSARQFPRRWQVIPDDPLLAILRSGAEYVVQCWRLTQYALHLSGIRALYRPPFRECVIGIRRFARTPSRKSQYNAFAPLSRG